jgi:hypothetical protein
MTAIPPRSTLVPIGELAPASFKTLMGQLHDFLTGLLGTDGTAAAARRLLEADVERIQPITASVGSGALTITLGPTALDFRSATVGLGTVNTRSVDASISLVVSAGSTLGTNSGEKARLAVLAIDNAGTVELAVRNVSDAPSLLESGVISTVAEDGAGGADLSTVYYSAAARTDVPYRVVGYLESTQETAGTWATSPSVIQGAGGRALRVLDPNAKVYTTGGTSSAYTLTPDPALVAPTQHAEFDVIFHTSPAAASTLSVSGTTAKALKFRAASGAKVAITADAVPTGWRSKVVYDGTDYVVREVVPAKQALLGFSASVAANALSVSIDPCTTEFRSTTLTSGAVTSIANEAAISLTVPDTATLGTTNAVVARLVVLEINNAGAKEVAIVNLAGGVNLDETTLISTTALSTAADSAGVIYSTTARTNVAFRVKGFIDITEATAGTWATAPTLVQPAGGGAAVPVAMNAGGSAPLFACRAWVNFNGAGTVAIRASGNVSSITDNGVGDYTVNFTTAMPDADYAVALSASRTGINDGATHSCFVSSSDTRSAGSKRIRTFAHSAASFSANDAEDIYVSFHR